MPADRVVEHLDVVEHIRGGHGARRGHFHHACRVWHILLEAEQDIGSAIPMSIREGKNIFEQLGPVFVTRLNEGCAL